MSFPIKIAFFPAFFPALFFLASVFYGCDSINKEKVFPNSSMYELSKPELIKLPDALDEISGIAFYPKDSSLFAIVDEDPILYKFRIRDPKTLHHWLFDKKRDMEDLVLLDSTFYVLVSNGDIVTIHFIGDSLFAVRSNFSNESKKVFEFESLYTTGKNNLTLLCKDCDIDSASGISTFLYDISSGQFSKSIVVNTSDISKMKEKKRFHLKASAATINPVTGDLYILSAINNLLVIATPQGHIKEVYPLDPFYYKQPEGITFSPDGDMYICNEYAEIGTVTLLYLKNKKKGS